MDVDDFIRDDKSAAVFLNEMIKLDSGDGSMVRLAIGNIIKCHNVSEIAKTAMTSAVLLWRGNNNDLQRRMGDIRLAKEENGIWAR